MAGMHFLNHRLVELAIHHFDNLDVSSDQAANWYFETFGPGNVIQAADRPHERFADYEELMVLLHRRSPGRYREIHKGTPFYFMAWLAFDLRNYEKALFYIDAAISEDVRRSPDCWAMLPAAKFLSLEPAQHPAGARTVPQVRSYLQEEIDRFSRETQTPGVTLDAFLKRFVLTLLGDARTRTLISAFYILLLEARDRYAELCLRSTAGGSIGPVVALLFRGGLVLESLLKHLYPTRADGTPNRTLGRVFNCPAFQADFVSGLATSAASLADVLAGVSAGSIESAFSTTARLRNTAGHNLIWDDIFDDPENFQSLWRQEVNSILFVVQRKFL